MIKSNTIKIGSRVRLKEDHKMHDLTFLKGHEFTIYDESYRGWDLIDDNGNKIDEALFIHHKFELVE